MITTAVSANTTILRKDTVVSPCCSCLLKKSICLFLLFIGAFNFAFSQSTSESVSDIEEKADHCMYGFIVALRGAGDNPNIFLEGAVSVKAETAKSDLGALLRRIDEQSDVISKKEVGIEAKALPESEKKELLTILASQKTPLQTLKSRIATFQQKLNEFTQTDAARWKETYISFESVSGADKAKEKLNAEIGKFLKSIPFASALEKKSNPSPSPQPVDDSQGRPEENVLIDSNGVGEKYTNFLGQTYISIPGVDALFCVWDTRVSDYEAFIRDTGLDWKPAGFPQGANHPAVRVSYYDAMAFCKWLTEKDEKLGKLPEGYVYRLPRDLEWSVAAGIGHETEGPPASRNGCILDCYAWGTAWPPPRGSGNYDPKLKTDKFPYTSPVGSFPPNRFGLYDMNGNVYQWVEELFDDERNCLRGAAWPDEEQDAINLTNRWPSNPSDRFKCYGFRCVLAPVD